MMSDDINRARAEEEVRARTGAIRDELLYLMQMAQEFHDHLCKCGCREKLVQAALAFSEVTKASKQTKSRLDVWYNVNREP